ncbi:MAG: N-acetyltransferase [Myxococcales bacterium]|nr:N-acetyltransferase [Myxococcales bacterium]
MHETAVVDEGARIGEGSKIWHFCHVMPDTTIGRGCSFGQNCVVGPHVRVGDGVKVQNNVSIYEGVEIEDDVFLGPSMVFTNVINPRAFIARRDEFRRTLVRRGATIGANATIVCGVTIGRYALIGAGAVVTRDVVDHALVVGVPGRQVGWVSRAGNTLTLDARGEAHDAEDGTRYQLRDGVLELLAR